MSPKKTLLAGAVASLAFAELWHGPLGAGNRLTGQVERTSRRLLDRYEMTQVQARLSRGPLSRTLILSGPADAFQRTELVRVMGEVPGVWAARWDPNSLPKESATR
jgi:hypothetical protein